MPAMLMRILALTALLQTLATACNEDCMLQADAASDAALGLLQRHATSVAAKTSGAIPKDEPAPCNPFGPVQVFSDVDDTFISSGGSWPAGCDGVYEKSVIYPGFTQFVLELTRGENESLHVLRPALFSARPEEISALKVSEDSNMASAMEKYVPGPKPDPTDWDQLNMEIPLEVPDGLESYDYQQGGIDKLLKRAPGEPFGLNVEGSKYGHLLDGTDTHAMGATKFENFQEFYMEEAAAGSARACVIFIGDDGQGDCNPAAKEMRNYVKNDPNELGLKAAFIHRLTCSSKARCEASEASPGSAPVIKFDDYLDAARKAKQHGLISAAGVQRVRSAVALFFAVYCKEDGKSRLTETLNDLGCNKLKESLAQDEGPAPSEETVEEMRPVQRVKAWCKSCCNGSISNHRTTYNFRRKNLRCHHMYQENSWWHLWSNGASDGDCRSHCT